ncbi:hypothetical protein [Amaricoccus tamworthensis]|uniref:hypothetical protein n=1 Tax=Amaricoccus tamworthensis TaxID=57002 RepID=UPI003C7ED833
MEVPSFLGREGSGDSTFSLGGPEPLPEPVAVSIASATVEPALHGVIVRVEGVAPTQGYYGASLVEYRDGEPGPNGLVEMAFVALPPDVTQQPGPAQTRELRAARFYTNAELESIRGVSIQGAGVSRTLSLR